MKTDVADWFAVDWGTSNLRVWAMASDGHVITQMNSDQGMGSLSPDAFEPALLDLIEPFIDDRDAFVICCGMVGAKQGWSEAPYAKVPGPPPNASVAHQVLTNDPRLRVRILPGLMQAAPADVMRGEETQIAGFLSQNPEFDGTLCLPGTHTKWVQISAGEIVSFRTFMSGELFALLSEHSVLKHSVVGEGWSPESFTTAVDDAMSSPQQFAARLFGLRAEGLVNELGNVDARSGLSGLLIGLELAAARGYWLGQNVAVLGDPALAELYQIALGQQGVPCRIVPGDELSLAGLIAAYRALEGTKA